MILYNDSGSITNTASIDSLNVKNSTSGNSRGIMMPQGVTVSEGSVSSIGESGTLSSIIDKAQSYLDDDAKSSANGYSESEANSEDTEIVTDSKIRNIFLESMCFIPELVTSNGSANLDLTLSDNITTWTIQTVGNTKDGRIGYSSINDIKVFKEFFADFELPHNLVVGDIVSIPVTVYNYTDNTINTNLKISDDSWFKLNSNNNLNISIEPNSSKMEYISIEITEFGNNKFRVEASDGNLTDIIEKEAEISPNGYKIEKVVSTGVLDDNISEDLLILDNIVENTAKAKVKIYASTISQAVEGMENIFKMPTGCFEQVSSSLYPNILALKYLEDNGIVDENIKSKAIEYISSGYQKLLAYEVKGESGGYSLYGDSPAETVLTAYGLMELTDLKQVYKVDENVTSKMNEFLYGKQNLNGSFTITGYHKGGASSGDQLALNAYIIWALSESNPKEPRLTKSIEYLKGQASKTSDNYTLALIANALANVNDKEVDNIVKRLINNINIDGNKAYLTSNVVDYYGSRSNAQNVQTVALTSMALSKTSKNLDTNKLLINYLISQKDKYGTWYNTQATILALKALNEMNQKNKLENQTISVTVNSDEQEIEIGNNPLEIYQLTFDNLNKENKLDINIKKGGAYYEVVEEYYVPYENLDTSNNNIEITVDANTKITVAAVATIIVFCLVVYLFHQSRILASISLILSGMTHISSLRLVKSESA